VENLPDTLQNLTVDFLIFLPKLVVAIVILVITLYLAGVARRLIKKTLSARGVNVQVAQLLSQLARWGILVLGIVIALQQVDFDITGLVAGLGIVGFALGFALQDIAANFISGIILLIQQPFEAGNLIEVNGYLGHVKAVDLRATLLQTQAGEDVLIPNGTVLSSSITNYSKSAPKRVAAEVGVAYDSDLEKVRRTALDAVMDVPQILTEKPPFVRFHTFGGSSIDLPVYFWVYATKIHPLDAKDAGVTLIKAAFDQAGIEIPFPIQTVYMQEAQEA
jgi:small conductance mechanosensitive channel